MAEEVEEKSNFVKILVGFTIAAVILVSLLKSRETDHLVLPGATSTLESNADALSGVKRFENNHF